MRGSDVRTGSLISYVGIEARLRSNHPLRVVRALTDETLAAIERDFASLYSQIGRPSIPPQTLLRAMLLQAFHSVRSERQLMERMEFDLLFRWFRADGVASLSALAGRLNELGHRTPRSGELTATAVNRLLARVA